jgi:flavorubredoxin
MASALVVYATRTNQTKAIADLIAEGLRMSGIETTVMSVAEVDKNQVNLEDFDALILGAATYHGEMIQPMKTFLFSAEQAQLEGKVGGAFGAFGWSGEAPGRIFETMQHVFKMDMVDGPLMLKNPSLGGGKQMAQSYGKEIAEKLASKS